MKSALLALTIATAPSIAVSVLDWHEQDIDTLRQAGYPIAHTYTN